MALENGTTDCDKWSVKLFTYDGSLEVSVETADKILYMVRDVMIFNDFVNKAMMDFAKCIFQIK